MNSLTDFALKEKYKQVEKLRSRLEEMKSLLDWDAFSLLLSHKKTGRGRPPYDRVLLLRCLFLQAWHSLSDEELEYQLYNRLDFQQFLDFPKNIPDHSTIWRFREELTEADLIEQIWQELQRQLNQHHLTVKEGIIQDATFVHADPGKKNSGMSGRGRSAKTSRNADATWTKKGKKSIFGYKLHTKMQRGSKLICELAVTTAKTHDGHIDLANEDEINYRDRAILVARLKQKVMQP